MSGSFTRCFLTKRLDWIQVEVTSHCNAACSYCPHTLYRDHWTSRQMSLEIFQKLLPPLTRPRLIHLQGWGEPFLHPDFFAMVSLAKEAGCRVGTTTNGMLLDAEMMTRLVDLEVDVVAFSLAGLGEAHDRVRRGTRFAKILENLKTLRDLKARKGAAVPKLHVAYMLLRSGLRDLDRLPQALRGLGVSQVVVSTLDFAASPAWACESLALLEPGESAELAARLTELAARSQRQGLRLFHYFSPSGPKPGTCPENIDRAVYVAADGAVSPCVYVNLPVTGVTHINRQGEQPYERRVFGYLGERSLMSIWRDPVYRQFRRDLARGDLPLSCRGCLKLGAGRP